MLRYVRVEFSGIEFSPDNELNGIAFQGVGRGTQVDYVQAHMSRDDAMEWFGGTVDVKYVVMSNAADDSLDWTFGWTGRVQFVAVTQRGDDADNGIEADNNEFNNNALPRSNPQIYNITMCGDPDRNEGGESPRGANLRRGTAFTIRNFLITGFKTVGLPDRDDQHGDDRAGRQRHVADGRRRRVEHRRRPMHASVTTYINSGRFPNVRHQRQDPGVSTPACSNHAAPNFQPSGDRHAGRRPAGADSAAERRVLRGGDLHRRGAAGARAELDGRLDVVSAELMCRGGVTGRAGPGGPARFVYARSDESPCLHTRPAGSGTWPPRAAGTRRWRVPGPRRKRSHVPFWMRWRGRIAQPSRRWP